MHRAVGFVWLLGVLSALALTVWRWKIESGYKTVALVIDGVETMRIQAWTGLPLYELLSKFQKAGATGLAVSATTLGDWITSGEVQIYSSNGRKWLIASNQKLLLRFREAMNKQFNLTVPSPHRLNGEGKWAIPLKTSSLLETEVFIGLDRELAQIAQSLNFAIIVRLPNPPILTQEGLRFWLNEAKTVNADVIVFEGEEVLGYKTMLDAVAKQLKRPNWQIGFVELTSQMGDRFLASLVSDKVVRVHSVSSKELTNFTTDELVERFVRSVRERNIRLCYIRIPTQHKGDLVDVVVNYLTTLRDALQAEGFKVGLSTPLHTHTAPLPLWSLVWCGAIVTGITFLCAFINLSNWQRWVIFLSLSSLGTALRLVNPIWAAKVGAFGLAVTAPFVAIWQSQVYLQSQTDNRYKQIVISLLICFIIIVSCGLMESALMFDHRFWLKVTEFTGVKLSQLLPFVFVLAFTLVRWWDNLSLPPNKRFEIAKQNFFTLSESQVRWGQVMLLMIASGFVVYWLMRTGNEPLIEVTIWELKARALFENLFGIRPRFKEFVFGHPALVLAFYFLTGKSFEKRIGQWLLVPAVIGLTSIMNSFSHLHTPISISIVRTAHGVWLGVLIGVFIMAVLHKVCSKLRN